MTIERAKDILDDLFTFGEGWGNGVVHIPKKADEQREALKMAIDALEMRERLEDLYHNFCGYDLEKCKKHGEDIRAFDTLMIYEIGMEIEDLLPDAEVVEE